MNTFKAFLAERALTAGEKSKAEKIVKGMKKAKAGFQARYGDKAKSVMYATATKLAKEDVQLDEGWTRSRVASDNGEIHHTSIIQKGPNISGIIRSSYRDTSGAERVHKADFQHHLPNGTSHGAIKKANKHLDDYQVMAVRNHLINKHKLVKEEVQIDELSKGTLKNYTKKALDSIRTHAYLSGHHDADNMYGAGSPKKKSELTGKSVRYYAKAIKRGKGVQSAVNKLTKEETQINELKTDTMKKYIQTAADDLRHQAGLDAHYKRDFGKKPGPAEKKLLDKKHRKVSTRLRGIKTAADRIAGRSDWE